MKIAVIGWGSLIWDVKDLKIKNKDWHTDGPILPIEFARISTNNSLTLVLYNGSKEVQTLWNEMSFTSLHKAKRNLQERERCAVSSIGYINLSNCAILSNVIPKVENPIKEWAAQKKLDAVIWTDLKSNFKEKTGNLLTIEAVIGYLKSLNSAEIKVAREYITKAPIQTTTAMRSTIQKYLDKKKQVKK